MSSTPAARCAPAILAMFLNTAIDQQLDRLRDEHGRERGARGVRPDLRARRRARGDGDGLPAREDPGRVDLLRAQTRHMWFYEIRNDGNDPDKIQSGSRPETPEKNDVPGLLAVTADRREIVEGLVGPSGRILSVHS